jgi:hypothetical protein
MYKDNIKMYLLVGLRVSIGFRWLGMDSIEGGKFLDKLTTYYLLKRNSASSSCFLSAVSVPTITFVKCSICTVSCLH